MGDCYPVADALIYSPPSYSTIVQSPLGDNRSNIIAGILTYCGMFIVASFVAGTPFVPSTPAVVLILATMLFVSICWLAFLWAYDVEEDGNDSEG